MPLLIASALVGLVLLTKGADQLVVGGARLALTLRVSAVAIGVLLAVGTTSPELIVSGLAAGQGAIDIAIGNIVGSNVANLTLVLGTAGVISPVVVAARTVRGEAVVSTTAVVLFAVLVQGGVTRLNATVLLVGLLAAVLWLVRRAKAGDPELLEPLREIADTTVHSVPKEALRTVLGLGATLLGAQLLVFGARGIAEEAGLAEGFVGLTLVAIGTSLPELVTAIQAARHREHGLITGTLLGANMLNSLSVGAIAGLVSPGPVDPALTGEATIIMVCVAALAWVFMSTGGRIARWEAAVLLSGYPAIVALVGLP